MARVFTVHEAAEYLRVTPHTVRKWLRTGKIPGRKIGRIYRVPQAELEAALLPSAEDVFVPRNPEKRLKAADLVGKYAHVPFSTADLAREHQEEIERDERWYQEHFGS